MIKNVESMRALPFPKALSRAEKKSFREGFEAYFGTGESVSQPQIDSLMDLIRAKARLEALQSMLDAELQEMKKSGVTFSIDLLALIRQTDSTSRLTVKLADRLKAQPKAVKA
ncbi:hypothetical protein X753_24105 [Mesorhizobium sp. LNJC399B00]|uniref:hypothetical protein n=1 Tax=unclassified Mesorhizobium TaxID=325217 RepID=UPI0003CF6E78|nr:MULTISPECIES: hypothetical protein [unclassified Mesorhizobium]ESY03246.1 hypothetical protein X753_24105 [Mesorhizobium sp. LNJC399B00]WJI69381.1 hypothetical protein NLY36_00820 [Mesorhizobium sp. C399B]